MKPSTPILVRLFCFCLSIACFAIMLLFLWLDAPFMSIVSALLGVFWLIPACALHTIRKAFLEAEKRRLAAYERQQEKERQNFHITFYQKCKEHKITNIYSAADKQRAILIGNQLHIIQLTESNVDEYFQRGRDIIEGEEKRKEAEEIQASRIKIQQEVDKSNNLFKSLYGRAKRIRMINDKLIPLKKSEKAISSTAYAVMSSAKQEKELDWASMGGAASALGGTAAGIAVAAQAQRENENIKARNAANQAAVNQLALPIFNARNEIYDKIEGLEKMLKKAPLALIDDKLTKEDLFDRLSITYTTRVDDLGVLHIDANMKLKQELIIFDTVQAAVDGIFAATIFLNGKFIGGTILVAPLEGIHSESKNIRVSGRFVIPYENRFGKFTVNIVPYSLWAIEKAQI